MTERIGKKSRSNTAHTELNRHCQSPSIGNRKSFPLLPSVGLSDVASSALLVSDVCSRAFTEKEDLHPSLATLERHLAPPKKTKSSVNVEAD
jgi:hypothetical protein